MYNRDIAKHDRVADMHDSRTQCLCLYLTVAEAQKHYIDQITCFDLPQCFKLTAG